MSNPYLRHYAKKMNKSYGAVDQFGLSWRDLTPDFIESGIDAAIIDPAKTAGKYYLKKWDQHGIASPLAVASELTENIVDYSQTQKEASKRNEDAWRHKSQIATAWLSDSKPWPKDVPKNLSSLGRAYPNLPSTSVPLGMAPNSPADAYAQGAIIAAVSAKLFGKPVEFGKLATSFGGKAATASNDITKGAPTQKAMKQVIAAWLKVAIKTGVISSWYNLIGQIKNLMSGDEKTAISLKKRMKLFSTPAEIDFSQDIAKQSQASFMDLLWVMRGWIGLGTLVVVIVLVAGALVAVPGAGAAAGRALASGGRLAASGVSNLTSAASSALAAGKKSEALQLIAQAQSVSPNQRTALNQRIATLMQAQAAGQQVSDQKLKELIRQVMEESK